MANKEFNDLFATNFLPVSRPMIRLFGIEAALMLCELYAEYRYYEGSKRLEPDGYFYSTVQNVEQNAGLSKGQQLRAIKLLSDYGIIKKTVRGMPGKRYFQFQYASISKLKRDVEIELRKDKKRTIVESCNPPEASKVPTRPWPKVDTSTAF